MTATLNVAANASGHAKLTFTPSLTSTSGTGATPEPATLGLFGLGLLGLGLVYRRKLRTINA